MLPPTEVSSKVILYLVLAQFKYIPPLTAIGISGVLHDYARHQNRLRWLHGVENCT